MNGVSSPTMNLLTPEHYRQVEQACFFPFPNAPIDRRVSKRFLFLLRVSTSDCDRIVTADDRI